MNWIENIPENRIKLKNKREILCRVRMADHPAHWYEILNYDYLNKTFFRITKEKTKREDLTSWQQVDHFIVLTPPDDESRNNLP